MRIIAGTLKGRLFDSPHSQRTHPMSDKVRGALFNILGDVEGLTICDAFAGSGAIAFEAASRGAAMVTAIESDHRAAKTIAHNIQTLSLESQVKLIKAPTGAWLATSSGIFDVIILDPQYDNLQVNLLKKIIERVKPGGMVVLSLPPNVSIDLPAALALMTHKSYGDAELWFYRRQIA